MYIKLFILFIFLTLSFSSYSSNFNSKLVSSENACSLGNIAACEEYTKLLVESGNLKESIDIGKRVCRIQYTNLCITTVNRLLDANLTMEAKAFSSEILINDKKRGKSSQANINMRKLLLGFSSGEDRIKIQTLYSNQINLDRLACEAGDQNHCHRYKHMKTTSVL